MADERVVGVQEARLKLREFIDAAIERGERTVISRHGRPVAVLGPYVPTADRPTTEEG